MSKSSRKIGRERRMQIYYRDKFTCRYCGANSYKDDALTLDHLVPVLFFKAGSRWANSTSNLVTACKECNEKKGTSVLPRTKFRTGSAYIATVPLMDLFTPLEDRSAFPLTATIGEILARV